VTAALAPDRVRRAVRYSAIVLTTAAIALWANFTLSSDAIVFRLVFGGLASVAIGTCVGSAVRSRESPARRGRPRGGGGSGAWHPIGHRARPPCARVADE
jgi:hypothetical protein